MATTDLTQLSMASFIAVYVAGLATSLTPCVYPLIPIVIGYLGRQSGSLRLRFLNACCYVLGLSFVYCALGLVAALTGSFFGALTANSTVYVMFGIFMLVLGGSMMDLYSVPLPHWLQYKGKADTATTQVSLTKSFLIGAASGIVATPCTAPVLAAILALVANSHQVVKGGLLMFTFALGMNTLLLGIGVSANLLAHLPRSGAWMVVIKKILALLLLATGVYFIFRAGQIS